ncbi:MAG: signal recognition particle receptor subunit alpha, partial [Cloacibacillus porcorum]|nr:signal recognition particle receptor subunit alpha [Cloacibacillus porcorum]
TQSVSNIFSDDPVTDDFWDELEENLILGDVGIDTTETLIADLKQVMVDRRITNKRELKAAFAELLISRLEAVPGMGKPLDLSRKPSVVIMIGVNGSGKTTTSGKLASQLKAQGGHVIMAAAATFRAAAIDQR